MEIMSRSDQNEAMRFSLRTLLAIVTAVAVVCGVTVWAMKQSPDDVLRNAHIGRNDYIGHGKRSMRISRESNLHWPALKASQTLTPPFFQLIVADRQWNPELARWIEAHPTVKSYRFENCQGFDEQFTALLEQRDGLVRLEFRQCDLSQFTFPTNLHVRALNLDDSIVTDEQLQSVATYQHLTHFSANGTWLTDKGVSAVCHLPLRMVSLMDTSVSKQLVERLLEIDSIAMIYLCEPQFTYKDFLDSPVSRDVRGIGRISVSPKKTRFGL